jgi:hypothetical protein
MLIVSTSASGLPVEVDTAFVLFQLLTKEAIYCADITISCFHKLLLKNMVDDNSTDRTAN